MRKLRNAGLALCVLCAAVVVMAPGPPPNGNGDIDIKPWSYPNSINLKSKGLLPVAVLGSAEFDVTTLDPTALTFGDPAMTGRTPPIRWAGEDVNGDGYLDGILLFSIPELVADGALGPDSEEGTLFENGSVVGTDTVRIVPNQK